MESHRRHRRDRAKAAPANALARSVIEELSDVFENVYKDDAIKVAIIYGEGRFCGRGRY